MGRKKDRFWEYAEEVNDDDSNKLKGFKCIFCHTNFIGSISRIKPHLAKVTRQDISVCTHVPDHVQKEASIAIGVPNKKAKGAPSTSKFERNKTTSTSASSPSTTWHHSTALELCNNKDKVAVDNLLAKVVVLNNIPINVIQAASFSSFVQGVAEYGPEYRLPSDSTLKTKLISDLRMEVNDYVGNVKKSWVTTGCTLMLDLWNDKKQGDLISIIAYSPKGAVFMKAFEIPKDRKEDLNLTNTVSSIVKEIGPHHVVQFITNDRKFESVGDELVHNYRWIYKTRCAAHAIHLLLKDIYEKVNWVKKVIDDANLIVTYMYKNTIISSLMREHTNKELKRPCMIMFASNFLMLQSIFDVENELQSLVASSEWKELDCNKEDLAKGVTSIIGSTEFWREGKEVLQVLQPFVRVLQLAESDGSTLGYLYEAMERAKGEIKQLCYNNQAKYMQIWELFEESHYENIIHPIHATAAYLNPVYMCSENFTYTPKMMEGINFIQENLVAFEEKKNFLDDVQNYHIKASKLFTNMAITMLETSHPCIWWELNGCALPTLKKYAIRILSHPCSSSSCERNWSVFEAVQMKTRNRLAPKLLDNLGYVRMNTMMMEKFKRLEAQCTKPIDLDKLSELPEYAHHDQDCEGDTLDAIDEGFDDDVVMKVSNPSQLDEAQGTKPIDLDKLSEQPEYPDHEKDCEGNVLDAIDEGFDDYVIMNDADPSRLEENSFYEMDSVGESFVSAFLQQLFNKLNSPQLQKFALQEQVDTELKEWEKILSKIYAVVDDAEEKQMENSNVKIWLSELTGLAYDVEDILDEISTEALRQKLMVEHKASSSNVQTHIPDTSTGLNSSDIISQSQLAYDTCIMLDIATKALLTAEHHASTNNAHTFIPASSSGLNPSGNFNIKIDEITSRLQEIVTQKDNLNLREKAGHLPSHLKRCFVYCAIFPKGYEFDKDELVMLWMAEGFLQETKEKKHTEDLGLEYFQELLSRHFFQQSSGNKSSFVMPGLIHDLAKSLAGEICFSLEDNTLDKSFEKVRHSSFSPRPYDASQRFEVFYEMKGLRTFLASPVLEPGFNRAILSNKVLHDLLPKLRYLRSLSLNGYTIRELPKAIGDLKQLRYLSLSYSRIQRLPESLSALLNLQTLILSYSHIQWLPESLSALLNLQTLTLRGCKRLTKLHSGIGNLTNLHHLDISDTNGLYEMPLGIGNLSSLQTLPRFIVGKGDRLRVRDLKNLSHLRGQLSILKLRNVVDTRDACYANLKEKQGLDDLELNWRDNLNWSNNYFHVSRNERDDFQVLDWLQPHTNLKKLTIASYDGTEFPPWIGDPSFSNLVQLNLCYCRQSRSLPSLGGLPLLKDLRIEGMNAIRTVGLEFYGVVGSNSVKAFPSLESLSFNDMLGWEEWFSCTSDEVGDVFPCLRKLVLQNCPKLNVELSSLLLAPYHLHISSHARLANSFVSIPSLHELKISKCNFVILTSLVNLISLTTLKIEEISGLASLDILGQPVALEVVEIENCSELMYLWEIRPNLENLACLKKLVVKRCLQLVSLIGDEGGLLPCNLEELELENCHELEKLPNGLHSLTCLRSLSIKLCPKLMSFPATGLPYTLRRLELRDCKALESLPDGMTIHGGNNNQCLLEELVIYNCPKLESLPEGMMLDDNNSNNTSHLKSLEISYCKQLKSVSERILHNNTSLEVIRLISLDIRSLPLECLHRLTQLSELEISYCSSLESFPERGLSIPNLKSLTIKGCWNLKSLPNQMHNLTSLQTLTIWRCSEIVSFPEGGLPPNLTSLEISYCENLKQSMSEWGLYRLSSLRKFILQFNLSRPVLDMVSFPDDDCSLLPTTLTYICIHKISNLESISKGIQNLTSLEKLQIGDCPKLHSLPKEGLPASLGYLHIWGCPILEERCLKEKGEYWPIISHIPCVKIDFKIQ